MQSMRVLPLYSPTDSVVVHWGALANANEDVRNFLGALVSVACDFADIIVITEPSEVENISQGLASLEIPEDYVQYVVLPTLPACLPWLFLQDSDQSIHLVQSQETVEQTALLNLLRSQDDFFSAQVSAHLLNGLNQESLQVLSNGIAFIAQADLLLTGKTAEELANTLGLNKLISLVIPTPFVRLSQLLRATPQGLLVTHSAETEIQPVLELFGQTLEAAIEQMDIPIHSLPLPSLPSTNLTHASYGDFVVVNEAVLVPQFDCTQDEAALEAILSAFPGKEVYGIPAITSNDEIIELHSRVICLPEGTLFPVS